MRLRHGCWMILAASAITFATPVRAETNLRVALGIENAPPPPVVVYREAPPVVVVPRTSVYVVRDDRCRYDFFRYGVYWFIWNDGYWYRSRAYGGPFRVIEERYVPAAIWKVPNKHWKRHPHGAPPGLAKKHRHTHDERYVAKGRNQRDRGDD